MQELFLKDESEWNAFVDVNRDAIESQYGSVDKAYRHACQGGLEFGGGAAPLFVIFVDAGDTVPL